MFGFGVSETVHAWAKPQPLLLIQTCHRRYGYKYHVTDMDTDMLAG